MSSSFQSLQGVLGQSQARTPYVAGIPSSFMQGDSVSWNDNPFVDTNGVAYDSVGYAMQYAIAGPGAAPLVVASVANGSGWKTSITTAQSAVLKASKHWWQLQVLATGVRLTIANGELTVNPDLTQIGANYDGRTQAETALEQALAAYASFSASSGRVKSYTIGHRSMTFDSAQEIQDCINFWRARVVTEKSIAGGARDRHLHLRFDRTR